MDLSSVISAFASGTYTVTRATTASYGTDGRAVPGTTSLLSVSALAVPLGGRDLQNLPEGIRTKQLMWLYVGTELKTEGSGYEPDSVALNGDNWQVQSVEPWNLAGGFWRCLLMRVGN